MVNEATISKLLQSCEELGSVAMSHLMDEYVQFSTERQELQYLNRSAVVALQSPEAHRFSVITKLFAEAESKHHLLEESCCTMLLYNMGYPINFIEGLVNNIKIAREEDLAAFSMVVKNNFHIF